MYFNFNYRYIYSSIYEKLILKKYNRNEIKFDDIEI